MDFQQIVRITQDGLGKSGAVLNLQSLQGLREVDPTGALVQDLMRAFLESAGSSVSLIEAAAAAEDTEGMRRGAHTLKSSAANVGADNLSELCRSLEAMAKDGNLDAARLQLDGLRNAYDEAAQGIRSYLRTS